MRLTLTILLLFFTYLSFAQVKDTLFYNEAGEFPNSYPLDYLILHKPLIGIGIVKRKNGRFSMFVKMDKWIKQEYRTGKTQRIRYNYDFHNTDFFENEQKLIIGQPYLFFFSYKRHFYGPERMYLWGRYPIHNDSIVLPPEVMRSFKYDGINLDNYHDVGNNQVVKGYKIAFSTFQQIYEAIVACFGIKRIKRYQSQSFCFYTKEPISNYPDPLIQSILQHMQSFQEKRPCR